MKKIIIVCVNYNSYKELSLYLESINNAMNNVTDSIVHVAIADNSSQRESISAEKYENLEINQYFQSNLGYLPGACNVLNNYVEVKEYDYVVISNVDLTIEESFFSNLEKKIFKDEVAWVATQIWTEQEKRDKNPKILNRCSKMKLELIRLLYKYPVLDYIYTNSLYLRKKARPQYSEQDIYAGHGSFMMLTKSFFEEYDRIEYPLFLFGEEMFLAELIRNKKLTVRYVPDLCVIDKEHTSTSRMRKKEYYKYNLNSIDYILKNFYE